MVLRVRRDDELLHEALELQHLEPRRRGARPEVHAHGRGLVVHELERDLDEERSVKIESLEAAKVMKIKWLVLGCIEANFCK